jgi:hypothetical protein
MIRALPAETPVTCPETGSTVATAVLKLLQVPPVAPPLSIIFSEAPVHTLVAPVELAIFPASGTVLTVTTYVATFVPHGVVTV